MPEIKYQEDEDSEVVCCSCKHNIRCPQKGDLARIECYCAKDNHYIGYIQCMTNYCDGWERSERLRGESMDDVRLIDANALLEEIDEEIEECQPETTPSNKFISLGLKTARKAICRMPTISAQPVKYGKWVDYGSGSGLFCSECKHKIRYRNGIKETTVFSDGEFEFVQHPVRNGYYNFCPNCSTEMHGGDDHVGQNADNRKMSTE